MNGIQTVKITAITNATNKRDGTPFGADRYTGKPTMMQTIGFTDASGNARSASCFSEIENPKFPPTMMNTDVDVEITQSGNYLNIKIPNGNAAPAPEHQMHTTQPQPVAQQAPLQQPSTEASIASFMEKSAEYMVLVSEYLVRIEESVNTLKAGQIISTKPDEPEKDEEPREPAVDTDNLPEGMPANPKPPSPKMSSPTIDPDDIPF